MTNQEQYDSAWDELEQYRKIGTVEECRQAVEAVKCLAEIWERTKGHINEIHSIMERWKG